MYTPDAAAIRGHLDTADSLAVPLLEAVAETGSTNSDLLVRARELPDRSVLVAGHQTAGRGRHRRGFGAPPGTQMIVSVLLRPGTVPPARWSLLPLVAGLALRDTVRGLGVSADLKWPNDLLVGERKLAGILTEVAALGPAGAVVLGVGLNIGLTANQLPVPHASSLLLEGAAETDPGRVTALFLGDLLRWEGRWRAEYGVRGGARGEPGGILGAYRCACATLGRTVRAELPGGVHLRGVATDVDGTGALVVSAPDGTAVTVSAGDVTHLRAAPASEE